MDELCRYGMALMITSLGCAIIACGDDDPSLPPPPAGTNDIGHQESDAGRSTFDSVPLIDAGVDSGSTGEPESIDCSRDSSLGLLEPGAQGTVEVKLHPVDSPDVTCSDADEGVAAHNLRFNLASSAIIRWTHLHEGGAPSLGFHALGQECHEDSPCQIGASAQFAHPAGAGQLLRIEKPTQATSATLHFEVEDALCAPAGEGWCEDGAYMECYQGQRIDSYPCANHLCAMAGSCVADRCTDALPVVPGTPDAPTVIDGHRHGYTHSAHFDDFQGCELDNIKSESTDLFFAIDDIPSDRSLVVESLGQGTYGFFILSDCDASQCLKAGSSDEEFNNRIHWEPNTSVDSAIVAIRPSDSVSRAFSFAFSFDETEETDP